MATKKENQAVVLFIINYLNTDNIEIKIPIYKTADRDTFNVRSITDAIKGLTKARGINKKNVNIVVDGRVYSVDTLMTLTGFVKSVFMNLWAVDTTNSDLEVSDADREKLGIVKKFVEYIQIYHLDIKSLMSIDEHSAPKYMEQLFSEFVKANELQGEFVDSTKEMLKQLKFQQ